MSSANLNHTKRQEAAADSSVSSQYNKKPSIWKSLLCCFSKPETERIEGPFDSEKRQSLLGRIRPEQKQQHNNQLSHGQKDLADTNHNQGSAAAAVAVASGPNRTGNSSDLAHTNRFQGKSKEHNIQEPLEGSSAFQGKQEKGGSRFLDGRWSPSTMNAQYNPRQGTAVHGTHQESSSIGQSVVRDKDGQVTEETQEILPGHIDEDDGLAAAADSTAVDPAAAAVIDLKSPQTQTPLPLNRTDSPFYHEDVMNAPEHTAPLLGPVPEQLKGRKCLVLDLDETLVHSSFKLIQQADFVIPVEIEARYYNVYVIKRPGVDEFMKRAGELFEVVVFTASVSKYGDPLLDQLDINGVIHHRLFRESCYNYNGNYIKNLDQLGRPLNEVIIIDNSPASYLLHPDHAVPVSSWFSDVHDNELLDMIPFLEDLASDNVKDVSMVLDVNI